MLRPLEAGNTGHCRYTDRHSLPAGCRLVSSDGPGAGSLFWWCRSRAVFYCESNICEWRAPLIADSEHTELI